MPAIGVSLARNIDPAIAECVHPTAENSLPFGYTSDPRDQLRTCFFDLPSRGRGCWQCKCIKAIAHLVRCISEILESIQRPDIVGGGIFNSPFHDLSRLLR